MVMKRILITRWIIISPVWIPVKDPEHKPLELTPSVPGLARHVLSHLEKIRVKSLSNILS